jgi:putative transposase
MGLGKVARCPRHLDYRPPGEPHYGGIVERVIGTMMTMVHELPGATFSNLAQRGAHDSDKQAALTLGELQRWLVLAVASYHGQVHGTTWQTPAARWAEGVASSGVPVTVTNESAFLVDFLPVIRRTLTRSGFVIDHIHYFADALKPWIARRQNLRRFVIRRDPRDLSRIWVLDPDGASYLEVPYRTLSHPPVSIWEHRAALERLRAEGRAQVDEDALFRMVATMRTITDTAQATTRKARRDAERRHERTTRPPAGTPRLVPPAPAECPPDSTATAEADGAGPVRPFEVIEQW